MSARGILPASTANSKSALTTKIPWCRPVPKKATGCRMTPTVPPQRPDLATYSQREQISLGHAPTWNCPDITTNNYFPWKLLPTFFVNVRNLSTVASAINTLVTFSTSAFGIGMTPTPMSSQKLNLGAGQTAALSFAVPAALLSGEPKKSVYSTILNGKPTASRAEGSVAIRGWV
jgi:hypothetical protein